MCLLRFPTVTGASRDEDIRTVTGEQDEGCFWSGSESAQSVRHYQSWQLNCGLHAEPSSVSSLRPPSSAAVDSCEASSTRGEPGAGCCPHPQDHGMAEDKGLSEDIGAGKVHFYEILTKNILRLEEGTNRLR